MGPGCSKFVAAGDQMMAFACLPLLACCGGAWL